MFAHTMARVGTSKVAVPDVIDDPVANKVVIFASSKADLNAGEGPYGQTDVLSLGLMRLARRSRRLLTLWIVRRGRNRQGEYVD